MSSARTVRLHRQVMSAVVGVAAIAVLLFAVPLAVTAAQVVRDQARERIATDATRIAALVPDSPEEGVGQKVPVGSSEFGLGGVFGRDGERLGGDGPGSVMLQSAVLSGKIVVGAESGQ